MNNNRPFQSYTNYSNTRIMNLINDILNNNNIITYIENICSFIVALFIISTIHYCIKFAYSYFCLILLFGIHNKFIYYL